MWLRFLSKGPGFFPKQRDTASANVTKEEIVHLLGTIFSGRLTQVNFYTRMVVVGSIKHPCVFIVMMEHVSQRNTVK